MQTVGRRPWLRAAGLFAAIFGAFGCGDGRLAAILPAVELAPPPADECAAGEGQGAGPLPPMGWNGWNTFGCGAGLDQDKFRANADALVERGLQAAGYQYMNLDDCWQDGRAADGTVLVSTARFPDGLAALGAYVHEKGLKLGINSNIGNCVRPEQTTPGSGGHEVQDAATYASFGVDYVKYNRCGGASSSIRTSFESMRDALAQTGRPMLLSIVDAPFKEWHTEVGQLWRTHGDIQPTWPQVLDIVAATTRLAAYAGQGGFNDSDMLWIGDFGLSESESRAYFSMWSILASPLIAGNDLTAMSEATRAILTQPDLIAINQDPLRLQGALIENQGDISVYAKPLADCGARALVLLNSGNDAKQASVTWKALGLQAGHAQVRDLWAGSEATEIDRVTVTVPPHDAVALRVLGAEAPLPRGSTYLSDLEWTYSVNGWGPVERDQELGGIKPGDGAPLSLNGTRYAKGLGMNSPALVRYRMGKRCQKLIAEIGLDDSAGPEGSAVFQVWADGEKLFDSGVVTKVTPPRHLDLDVTGRSDLRLWVGEVEDIGQDHADWADAQLRCDD